MPQRSGALGRKQCVPRYSQPRERKPEEESIGPLRDFLLIPHTRQSRMIQKSYKTSIKVIKVRNVIAKQRKRRNRKKKKIVERVAFGNKRSGRADRPNWATGARSMCCAVYCCTCSRTEETHAINNNDVLYSSTKILVRTITHIQLRRIKIGSHQ